MKNITSLITPLTCALALSACGGSSSSNSLVTTDGVASQISGLWDTSYETGLGPDERYTWISPQGTFTDYDYDQDIVGLGENCYRTLSTTPTSLGELAFEFTFFGTTQTRQFTIDGDILTVQYQDSQDDDDDGDVNETIIEAYPRVEGVNRSDLTLCS